MERISTITRDSLNRLLEQLGSKLGVDSSMVIPFTDYTDMMTALLGHIGVARDTVLVGGYASPDIAIAADRAGLKVAEVLGASPFVSHPEDILEAIGSERDIVFLANPNWVTGSNYSFAHLDRIARAIPDGVLILDEKYFDFYGISGLPLLEQYSQVVIVRSLTAGFSIGSDESGCLVGSTRFIYDLKDNFDWSRMTTTMFRLLSTMLANEAAAGTRLTQVHDESLRIANELTQMGVQNRITATDFLLVRAADPKRVGNHLAGFNAPVENLEGYPGLENYLRYRIQSPLSNDNFLSAFRRMPSEYYRMADIDKRAVMFHRPKESTSKRIRPVTSRQATARTPDKVREEVPVAE